MAEQEKRIEENERRYLLDRSSFLTEGTGPWTWNLLEVLAIDEAIRRDAVKHPMEALTAVLGQIKAENADSSQFDYFISMSMLLSESASRLERRRASDRFLSQDEKWLRTATNEWMLSDPQAAASWLGSHAPANLMYWVGCYYGRVDPHGAMVRLADLDDSRKTYLIAGLMMEPAAVPVEDLSELVEVTSRISGQARHVTGRELSEPYEWDFSGDTDPGAKGQAGRPKGENVEEADYLEVLREWARKDVASAGRYAREMKPGEKRAWLEMNVALTLNGNDWAKANAWMLQQQRDRNTTTMLFFWHQWTMEDFDSFEKYRATSPDEFREDLGGLADRHRKLLSRYAH